jgi:hypothetical protein
MRISLHFLSYIVGVGAFLLACPFLTAQEINKGNAVFPKFKAHLVGWLPGGYKVGVVDIDRDGKLDIIGLATEPSCLVWYKNPSWEKYVLTSQAKEYIDLAPYDIDRNGRTDLAIAHEFGMSRTSSGGLVHWLRCPQDPAQEWPMYVVGAEPTSHRLKWADIDGDGRKELVNAPIMGRDAKAPLWDVGVNLIWYKIPEPPTLGPWEQHIIDNRLTVTHGICIVNWDNDGCDDVLVAGFEGVHLYQPQRQGNKIVWKKTKIGSGEQINPNKRGSSEIDLGTVGASRSRFLATVEPWHGNNVVVYTPDSGPDAPSASSGQALWRRSVIDTTFNEGHALICADLDGDGDDEIVAGYRAKGYGLYIYDCLDSKGERWQRIALDEGDMAASGLQQADINGDGRLDIICVGTATSNIKWYENLGAVRREN